MGASGWRYTVPFQQDVRTALDALRHEVFASGEYLKPDYYGDLYDLPVPVSLDELTGDPRYLDFLGDSGTHSIIDVQEVVMPDPAGAEYGEVMQLGENEYAELFGTARSSRAQFEPADPKVLHDYVSQRWTGRAAVLWESGRPAEIVFWGFPGD
jgi:hypothetical protein